MNSYQRRYLGALLEILYGLKSQISNSLRNSKRISGVPEKPKVFLRTYESLIRKKYKEIVDKLYELTKNDKREFSIFPKKVKKIPAEYKEIAKKWRIYLNIDVVNIDEL